MIGLQGAFTPQNSLGTKTLLDNGFWTFVFLRRMIGLQKVVKNQSKPLNTMELTKQPVSPRTFLIFWDEQTTHKTAYSKV